MSRLWAGWYGVQIPRETTDFIFSKMSRPGLGSTQPPFKDTRVSLPCPGVKWLTHEANHLPLFCTKVKSGGAILPLSLYAFMPCGGTSSHTHWCHYIVTCQDTFRSLLSSVSFSVIIEPHGADHRDKLTLSQSQTSLCIMEANGSLTCSQKPLVHPTPMARHPYWAEASSSSEDSS